MSAAFTGGSSYSSSGSSLDAAGSGITQSIFSSLANAGENAILNNMEPSIQAPDSEIPVSGPGTALSLTGTASSDTLIVVGILAVLAFFAFREL